MDSTVTAIKQQKRNPQRVNVYLNGEFAFPLAKIVAAWLKVGQKLGPEKIEELLAQDDEEKAFQTTLNFLSYRPRSQAEVEKNLRKHEISDSLIPKVIQRLKNANLLNDLDFAQRWVEDRSTFRPRGAFALKAELRQKGIAHEAIEQAISNLDEDQLAREAAGCQARKLMGLEWPEFRNKLSAHLSRRGFSYETVAMACKQAWSELKQTSRQEI